MTDQPEHQNLGEARPAGQVPHRYVTSQHALDETFADGVAGVMVERGVIKLDLFRVLGLDQAKKEEVRTMSHRIVMPLTAIGELQQVLNHFVNAMQQARAQQQARGQRNG